MCEYSGDGWIYVKRCEDPSRANAVDVSRAHYHFICHLIPAGV